MTVKFKGATALTGGGSGAIDSLDGDNLNDLDGFIVLSTTSFYPYTLDADSGAAEDSPDVITFDTNPGTKRAILLKGTMKGAYFTDDVGIGVAVPDEQLHIESSVSAKPILKLKSTYNNATSAGISFVKDRGAAPDDNNQLGIITFTGDDATQTQTLYSQISSLISDTSDTQESGQIDFSALINGTMRNFLSIGGEDSAAGDPAEVVINEDSADIDFRVESDTSANAFFVQGSDGNVGMGTATPGTINGVTGYNGLHLSTAAGAYATIDGATSAVLTFNDRDASVNKKSIQLIHNSDYLSLRSLTDAGGIGTSNIMVWETTGNVGIGTSTPTTALDILKYGTNTQTAIKISGYNDQTGYNPYLLMQKSHTDTAGTLVETPTATILGDITFKGVNSSSAFGQGVVLRATQNGAAGATYVPTDLAFLTYSSTGSNPNQLFLSNTGKIGINTATLGGPSLEVNNATGANIRLKYNDSANVVDFSTTSGGGLTIAASGGGIALTTDNDAGDDFTVNGTALVVEGDSGNVGIGIAAPASKLSIVSDKGNVITAGLNALSNYQFGIRGGTDSGDTAAIAFSTSDDDNVGGAIVQIDTGAAGQGAMAFFTKQSTGSGVSPVEAMRIDNAGNTLIGSGTDVPQPGSQSPRLQVTGTSAPTAQMSLTRFSADANPAYFDLAKSRGGAAGTNTVVADDDQIAILRFNATDGTNFITASQIIGEVDGTPGTNDMPGRLVFSTTNDGASSPTEKLRITNDGLVGIKTTAPDAALEINSATGDNLRLTYNDANGSATYYADFQTTSTGNLSIEASGGEVDFNGDYATSLQNFPDVVAGDPGYWFDGVDDNITIADTDNLSFGNESTDTPFSVIMALKNLDVGGNELFNKFSGGIREYGLYIDTNDYLNFRIYDGGSTDYIGKVYQTALGTGIQQVIGATYSGNSLESGIALYQQGKSLSTASASDGSYTAMHPTDGQVYIGNGFIGWYGNMEAGSIRVFNLELTAAEVKAFSNGAPIPYKYIGASQTTKVLSTLINNVATPYSTFDGASATGFHAIWGSGGQKAQTVAEINWELGKSYRITGTISSATGEEPTMFVRNFAANENVDSTMSGVSLGTGDFSQDIFVDVAAYAGAGGVLIFYNDAAAEYTLSNLKVVQIGCVLDLEPEGIGHSQWTDISGNELHGTVSGAIPTNLPPNHREKYIDLTVTDDTSFTLPEGYIINSIVLTSDGAIGGGIDIGTTNGGGEIVAAETISGAGTVLCTLVAGANYNTTGADDTIYITDADGTGWDGATVAVRVQMERITV